MIYELYGTDVYNTFTNNKYCLDSCGFASAESRTNHGTHIPVKMKKNWNRAFDMNNTAVTLIIVIIVRIDAHVLAIVPIAQFLATISQGWHTCAHSYLQDDRVLILIVVTWLCQCVKSMEELCMWESIRTGRWPPKSKRKPERQIPVPRENRHLAGQPEANLSMANSIQETIRTKITCQIVHLPLFPCYQWQTLSQFPCLPY